MSYRKHHVKNKINKIRPQKPIFAKLWFWAIVLACVLGLGAGYVFLFCPKFYINNIEIAGAQKTDPGQLKDLVFKISPKSIFIASCNKIQKEILAKYPEIEKISAVKKYPQTLQISLEERQAVGEYCTWDSGGDNCFLIDKSGVAFGQANGAGDYFIVRQADAHTGISAGQSVLSQNIMDAILKTNKILNDFHINLKEALVANSSRLDISTSENWKVYFNLDDSANISMQITKLNLLLGGEAGEGKRAGLRYIDLRPADRAIICDNSKCSN